MSLIGERFNDGSATLSQYRPHPPAASCYFLDGDAVDAGTVQETDQNITHLTAENYRHLVWQVLPGGMPKNTSYAAGFAGLIDVTTPPTGVTTDPVFQIPWGDASAMRFGPFFGVCDNETTGGWALRKVQCEMEINSIGTGHLVTYMAMTLRPDPPTSGYVDGTFFRYTNGGAGGYERWVKQMQPTQPHTPYTGPPRQCRPATTTVPSAARMVSCVEFYLWFGWFSSDTSNSIGSVSAFEVP